MASTGGAGARVEGERHARKMATDPIGAEPKGVDVADLAALTVAGNVLLNLDEMLMKR